jgi:hypothetical protein
LLAVAGDNEAIERFTRHHVFMPKMLGAIGVIRRDSGDAAVSALRVDR